MLKYIQVSTDGAEGDHSELRRMAFMIDPSNDVDSEIPY